MKCVIQRVLNASVTVDSKTVGSIEKGFLLLLGVADGDTEAEAQKLVKKIIGMRIFEDENGKMNLSIGDVGGEILAVSQFTSFTGAMRPEEANRLYELFVKMLVDGGVKKVDKGVFGADMKVSLINDGPVTILLDTETL